MSAQLQSKWYRVTKKHPCQICRHGDWCGYTDDGAVCCMRVESDKPTRNGGWLHLTNETPVYIPPKKIEAVPIDASGMWWRWFEKTEPLRLTDFAQSLGVDTDSLRSIGCAWADRAWAFPMCDASGEVIGIRLRNEQGEKWAVKGSRQGLFLPQGQLEKTLFIVEGPTDLAAALTLGLSAIGRPSCVGQEEMIIEYARNHKVSRVVIVTDNDEPGLKGAAKLQGMLKMLNCLYVPPCKDLREFVRLSGSRAVIESALKDLVWQR